MIRDTGYDKYKTRTYVGTGDYRRLGRQDGGHTTTRRTIHVYKQQYMRTFFKTPATPTKIDAYKYSFSHNHRDMEHLTTTYGLRCDTENFKLKSTNVIFFTCSCQYSLTNYIHDQYVRQYSF